MNNLYKSGLYAYLRTGKANKKAITDMYMNLITQVSADLSDYVTPDFNKYAYEQAINTGVAAFYKCPEEASVNFNMWCCTPAKMADIRDNMGISKKITTAGSDYSVELTVDEDCILIYNNSALYPDYLFTHFAEQLTENDISMSKLVKWARMTPIPKAKTDAEIAKFTTALQRIIDGEDITVVSDELQLLTDGHQTIDDNMLRLTDENAVEKLHFFDQHHEQLIRRIATLGGLPFCTTAKSAQNAVDELHDMDALSTFIIKDRIYCRADGFKRAAEFMAKSGETFDFKYKPNDVLAKQLEKSKLDVRQETAEVEKVEKEVEKTEAEIDKIEAETEQTETEQVENVKDGENNETENNTDSRTAEELDSGTDNSADNTGQ